MNREQAKSKIRMSVTVNKDYIKSLEKADEVINQIYDELEELQSRSCGGCKQLVDIGKSYKHCEELSINISHSTESTFCCNRHEAKPSSQ